jgi:hypothetical protein
MWVIAHERSKCSKPFWEEDDEFENPSAGHLARLLSCAVFANAETLTIATVNNGDMVRMQGLTDDFTTKNPDISSSG